MVILDEQVTSTNYLLKLLDVKIEDKFDDLREWNFCSTIDELAEYENMQNWSEKRLLLSE